MTGETLRSFLAVELPPSTRAQALGAIESLREQHLQGVRWVPEAHLHLTLKFLGDIGSDRIPDLIARVGAKLQGLAPFEASLGGIGAFPNVRQARVLWLGVTRGSGQLARLARKLESAARQVGVERERRPFHGHLTLGRLRQPGSVGIAEVRCPESPPFSIEEVVLYESRLSSSGSEYVPLARLPLSRVDAPENPLASLT